MPDSSGADSLTYTSTSGNIITTNTSANTNYYGTFVQDPSGGSIYRIDASINSFTNTYSLLGGGGYGSLDASSNAYPGGHAVQIKPSCSVITFTNKGVLLGGGGGGAYLGSYGGAGGGGGGGAVLGAGYGGSIVQSTTAGSGTINGQDASGGCGGGGPRGNGGNTYLSGGVSPGGLGGGTYNSTNYGSPGGFSFTPSNSQNAGTNTYNFRYGGGAGGFNSNSGGGGGGYGCGCAPFGLSAPNINGSGGGGGGGYGSPAGNSTIGFAGFGGNGGYSIYNQGTIQTLINGQGGPTNKIINGTTSGSDFPYGPLFYGTTNTSGLTNYKIIINSTSSYGQLWNTGWSTITVSGTSIETTELLVNFAVDASNSTFPTTLPVTYYQVLVNVKSPNSTFGSIPVNGTTLAWYLRSGTPVTIGILPPPVYTLYTQRTYPSYDLVLTNTYSGADNLTYLSTSGNIITIDASANANCFGPSNTTTGQGYSIYTIGATINSFTNTYSLLGGGGAGGPGSNPGNQGGHGLLINNFCTVTTVINKGALLGGGGGGAISGGYGGAGGGGGAGGQTFSGGSIVLDISAGSGSLDASGGGASGGGGPSGNGGSFTNSGTLYRGGLGGGTLDSSYGSPGGNAQGGNAGTNSFNFRYGGGAGTNNNYGSGGGGYGCGSANNASGFGNYGGGGGGWRWLCYSSRRYIRRKRRLFHL